MVSGMIAANGVSKFRSTVGFSCARMDHLPPDISANWPVAMHKVYVMLGRDRNPRAR